MSDDNNLHEVDEQTIEDTISEYIQVPMFILSVIMLFLLIIDLTVHLSPAWNRILWLVNSIIWWIFIAEYSFRVFTSENRIKYIKMHLIDALFILVPFLRVFTIFKAIQSIRLFRILRPTVIGRTFVTTRRGLYQLRKVLGDRSFPYVLAATLVVVLISALLIYLLERNTGNAVIRSYGDAVWWAIGVVSTVGNEMYPVTSEGRIVATVLMIYGVGIFGYIAATLASYFIRLDKNQKAEDDEEIRIAHEQAKMLREISEKLDNLSKKNNLYDNDSHK